MADTSMTPNNNGLLYAIIGALVVVVAGGGFYLYKMDGVAQPAHLVTRLGAHA